MKGEKYDLFLATIIAEFFYLKKWKTDFLYMPKGVCRKGKIKGETQE